MASSVLELIKVQAAQETQIRINTDRLTSVEQSGSSSLRVHVSEDDARIGAHLGRIEKLEAAVMILQATPGELKSISVELRGLRDGQTRIEQNLERHMNNLNNQNNNKTP